MAQQSECARWSNLCDAINALIERRLRHAFETGHTVNVPDLASEMTESLADLIVCSAPPEFPNARAMPRLENTGRGLFLVLVRKQSFVWAHGRRRQIVIVTAREVVAALKDLVL
jgi:hypothetical protein